jgi:hypothetical protein
VKLNTSQSRDISPAKKNIQEKYSGLMRMDFSMEKDLDSLDNDI